MVAGMPSHLSATLNRDALHQQDGYGRRIERDSLRKYAGLDSSQNMPMP